MLKKISALLLAVVMITVSMCACTSKEELETANIDLENVKSDLTSTQKELDEIKTELETTKNKLDTTSKELETTKEDLDKANAKLANINAKIDIVDAVGLIGKEVSYLEVEYPSIFNDNNKSDNMTQYLLGEIVDGNFTYIVSPYAYDDEVISNIMYSTQVFSDNFDELKDILLKEIYPKFTKTVAGEIITYEGLVQNMESLSKGDIEFDTAHNYVISYKTENNNSVAFTAGVVEGDYDEGKYMLFISINCQEYFEVELRI